MDDEHHEEVEDELQMEEGHEQLTGHRFASDRHPQFDMHHVTLRRKPVVPIIIGPPLPAAFVGSGVNDESYRYLMLLFCPWRSVHDLKRENDSWETAYQATVFSDYAHSLIANMTVDWECRDAKAERSFASYQELPGPFSAEDSDMEQDQLSSLLEVEDICH